MTDVKQITEYAGPNHKLEPSPLVVKLLLMKGILRYLREFKNFPKYGRMECSSNCENGEGSRTFRIPKNWGNPIKLGDLFSLKIQK